MAESSVRGEKMATKSRKTTQAKSGKEPAAKGVVQSRLQNEESGWQDGEDAVKGGKRIQRAGKSAIRCFHQVRDKRRNEWLEMSRKWWRQPPAR